VINNDFRENYYWFWIFMQLKKSAQGMAAFGRKDTGNEECLVEKLYWICIFLIILAIGPRPDFDTVISGWGGFTSL
jgi:hypothetical protein